MMKRKRVAFSFNPYCAGSQAGSRRLSAPLRPWCGFNPYCAGSQAGSQYTDPTVFDFTGFNPYCAGSQAGSWRRLTAERFKETVSILIVLEVRLEVLTSADYAIITAVSILIVLEVRLEALFCPIAAPIA